MVREYTEARGIARGHEWIQNVSCYPTNVAAGPTRATRLHAQPG